MEPTAQHLSDYLAVLSRRKLQVVIPAAVIFVASVVLAFAIPPLYRSTATMLIEQLEIPEDLVGTTITAFANERIKIISRRLMTHDNLRQIVDKLNLYPEKRQTEEIEEITARMRDHIQVETETTTKDRHIARSTKASIAFNLAFDADTPKVARSVANELVALYLKQNRKIREKKVEVTSDFLAQEEKRLATHVSRLEAKLAAHKRENVGRLPELMTLNLQQMERTERELEETERQILTAEERKIYLESKLAQLQPTTSASPSVRLRELQTQYLSASALYAPDHPDLVKMRREIELLEKEVGRVDQTGEIVRQLAETRAQLAEARETHSADHPDVIKLKKSIATLEQALQSAVKATQAGVSVKPDNPAYIAIQTELDAVKLSLKTAQQKRARMKAKLAEYERRLIQMPRVEQAGLALKREYDDATSKHEEIKQKLMELELATQLEWEQKGERYSLLEPPNLPSNPARPNRPAIVFLGLMLSLGAGIGFASLAEYMDRTVRGSKSITAVLGAPPLGVIPYIETKEDPYRQRRRA